MAARVAPVGEAASEKLTDIHYQAKELAAPLDACTSAMERVWPKELQSQAEEIMRRESGLNPLAANLNNDGSIDRGCFQVNSIHKQFDLTKLFEPDYNASAAWAVYQGQGWRSWTTAKGLYY